MYLERPGPIDRAPCTHGSNTNQVSGMNFEEEEKIVTADSVSLIA